ncbi:PR domain zinc finger protein 5-like isoform X1 [Vespa crabro]|uniref:PR domain zinc finger protein 5-like isoform X1 n=1 Tax=Vespa crabro TaxID=7445 RepID=UPI001F032201|nr:PR domain zinc finger protein 5-like isoform X1 [Vespa crabro]
MAVVNKWENACRLCSEEKIEMLPIFGNEGVQRKVAQKLRACLPVLVYKTDPLPKQICQFCAARLDDIYEFREYCLNVYKSMHVKLLTYKDVESVQIFFEAMKNSPDPCQAQLCTEKVRAPPPLVPLPSLLPLESSSMPNEINREHQSNCCIETLTELPCEVEIEEVNSETFLGDETCESTDSKTISENEFYMGTDKQTGINVLEHMDDENEFSKEEIGTKKEEKRTSILEQVLTGSLTMNDRKELKGRENLTSKWWCAPCNSYYKTRESLIKHMQLHCPRKYTCRKCPMSFESVEDLAKHEGTNHLKVTLDFDEIVKECHQCDRKFVSWEMLKQHRMRDHLGESIAIGMNTWCSLCNRFFPTIEAYHNHQQLHQNNNYIMAQTQLSMQSSNLCIIGLGDSSREIKKEHSFENTKSLTCPTCGKVCTQQSALSNHMRIHEPKRHKCDICGRSFGLFIRLAAHRMSEHNQQSSMSPVMACVEQEEALNAAREAREAREACTRGGRVRTYSEALERDNMLKSVEPLAKRNASIYSLQTSGVSKNVARCGICLQWFDDHTTMLIHLQTHSDFYTCKNFTCHICKISFKEKWQLFRHEMSHKRIDTSSSYICNVCNKTFLDKSLLKAHEKTHTMDKTYHCPKCNKLFFKEVSLLAHQCAGEPLFRKRDIAPKSTQNTKRYRCSKCNASFNNSQSKNFHMRVHAESINAAVRQIEIKEEAENNIMPKLKPETSLEYIMSPIEPKVEINEGSTPPPVKRTLIRTAGGYRCGVCQSPFVLRELAVAHLRSAHPVMPYQCPYCKKRFTTQYTFTHHIKTDHPDEPEK